MSTPTRTEWLSGERRQLGAQLEGVVLQGARRLGREAAFGFVQRHEDEEMVDAPEPVEPAYLLLQRVTALVEGEGVVVEARRDLAPCAAGAAQADRGRRGQGEQREREDRDPGQSGRPAGA
jgi:hypothetical protein